jgi:hypothetical protein
MKRPKVHPWRQAKSAPPISGDVLTVDERTPNHCVIRFNGREVTAEEYLEIKKEIERKQNLKKT